MTPMDYATKRRRLTGCRGGRISLAVAFAIGLVAPAVASSAPSPLVVAPDGATAAVGTESDPLALTTALAEAEPGQTIVLLGGDYDVLRDSRTRSGAPVLIRPYPGDDVRLGEVAFLGAQGLSLRDVDITGPVRIAGHPVFRDAQRAERITLAYSDLSTAAPGAARTLPCITIRGGSRDISVVGNEIHDCSTGIAGVVGDADSERISISSNALYGFTPDGIQFGSWTDVTIADNTIEDMDDGGVGHHTDAIQFVGDVSDVKIARNVMKASENGQLLFIQPQYGPIDQITVHDNLITGASGVAVQASGVTRLRFTQNTVWGNQLGGVLLRPHAGIATHDAIVANNALQRLSWYQGATPSIQTRNVLGATDGPLGSGDVIDVAPGFASDWTPLTDSILVGAASPSWATPTDLNGRVRDRSSVGALEPSVPLPPLATPLPTSSPTPTEPPLNVTVPGPPIAGGTTPVTAVPPAQSGGGAAASPSQPVQVTPGPTPGSDATRLRSSDVVSARLGAQNLRVRCALACRVVFRRGARVWTVGVAAKRSVNLAVKNCSFRVEVFPAALNGGPRFGARFQVARATPRRCRLATTYR
jgi:Right handed beta helix region